MCRRCRRVGNIIVGRRREKYFHRRLIGQLGAALALAYESVQSSTRDFVGGICRIISKPEVKRIDAGWRIASVQNENALLDWTIRENVREAMSLNGHIAYLQFPVSVFDWRQPTKGAAS